MAGIAGIAHSGRRQNVERMLDVIQHRGPVGRAVIDLESENITMGVVWTSLQSGAENALLEKKTARDHTGNGHLAEARAVNGGITLSRDPLGAAPLYIGRTKDGEYCFASEVKALIEVSSEVREVPPGAVFDNGRFEMPSLSKPEPLSSESPDKIAVELFLKLDQAVKNCLGNGCIGSWLSGGLDSSVLCALVRPYVGTLHTFSVGMEGSKDLAFARQVADALHTEHHELVISREQLTKIMPEVIYQLESFDARLVRSSLMNYQVGKLASDFVPAVLSGEASDELFAGYDYLSAMDVSLLADELLDIQARLHNTAFQRVDRCSSGHGLIAHIPFADPEVVRYVRTIPPELLIKNGSAKWILRYALTGKLPDSVLWRDKSKFWQGSGINDLFARIADESITDTQYGQEKTLPNGWILDSKEELLYYRAFKERFGELKELDWMGRTKNTGQAQGNTPKKEA